MAESNKGSSGEDRVGARRQGMTRSSAVRSKGVPRTRQPFPARRSHCRSHAKADWDRRKIPKGWIAYVVVAGVCCRRTLRAIREPRRTREHDEKGRTPDSRSQSSARWPVVPGRRSCRRKRAAGCPEKRTVRRPGRDHSGRTRRPQMRRAHDKPRRCAHFLLGRKFRPDHGEATAGNGTGAQRRDRPAQSPAASQA